MRILPKTSFYRTFLIIGGVVLLTQLGTFLFVAYFVYVPGVRQYSHLITIQMQSSLQNIDKQRVAEQGELQLPSGLTLIANPLPPSEKDIPFLPLLKTRLEDELEEPVKLAFNYDESPELWLQPQSLSPIWIKLTLESFGRYDFWISLAWLIGIPVIALLATLFSVRQIDRPLKQLLWAAAKIGRGDHEPIPIDSRDPVEISAVNKAFNRMAADLKQAAKDRALLLAGVSHDLRTPLTRMRLTAELLGALDPELREGMIIDVEDMDAILEQFISFIRDGSDEVAELGDINNIIHEVVKQAEVNHPHFQVHLGNIPEIYFKRLAFKRMITNVITNAIRHGGGLIEVETRLEEEGIVFSVKDQGPGIDEEKISELFSPFARGDESRSTMGSGLGLAIVRRICDMHHGRVELLNRPEGGLESKIILPKTGRLVAPEALPKGVR